MSLKAIIFDLDGVLVNTSRYHYLAWKRLANELGFDLSEKQNEQLKGISRQASLNILLSIGHLSMSDIARRRLAERKNVWFNEFIQAMTPDELFSGVRPLITQLRQHGLRISLASSSKNARTVLQQLAIEDLFEVVVDGHMIIQTKPAPEIFLLAARLLTLSPEECLVVEDAVSGVQAARAAGMSCIGIGQPDTLRKADVVVGQVSDLTVQNILQCNKTHISSQR